MRITEIGAWTPASGRTPGIRRPVRTITRPSTCFRRIRVRAADVTRTLGCDGGGFEAESRFSQRLRSVLDHLVSGLPAPLERQVEILSLHLEPEHVELQQADRLAQELLAGLVPVQHDHG